MWGPGGGYMGRCMRGEEVGTVSEQHEMSVAGSRQGREVEWTVDDGLMGVDMALVKADW